jgi:hypothetical protein
MIFKKDSIIVIVIIIIGTLLLSLFLFNLKECYTAVNIIAPETLGQFGDFYGGILGTIVTFFGLYFIYHTYQLQNKQLDIAKKDSDLEIMNKLYSDVLQEINSIQYRRKKTAHSEEILFSGIDALYNFDANHWNNPNSVLNHLSSIIVSFDQLIFMANKYEYDPMKSIMLTKVYFLYFSKIVWPVYQELYRNRKQELLDRGHPGESLFKNYERLTRDAYAYLVKGGHIGWPSETDKLMNEILGR